jgi:hypothetical protein
MSVDSWQRQGWGAGQEGSSFSPQCGALQAAFLSTLGVSRCEAHPPYIRC